MEKHYRVEYDGDDVVIRIHAPNYARNTSAEARARGYEWGSEEEWLHRLLDVGDLDDERTTPESLAFICLAEAMERDLGECASRLAADWQDNHGKPLSFAGSDALREFVRQLYSDVEGWPSEEIDAALLVALEGRFDEARSVVAVPLRQFALSKEAERWKAQACSAR